MRWCPDGDFWRLLHPVFAASAMQQVSDLHLKFALRPHHVCKYGTHPICEAEIRRGKKKKQEKTRNVGQWPTWWPPCRGNLCSTPQSLAEATTTVPCSYATKTRNPLKFAGVPQTIGPISITAGGPKFTILWGHVEEILLLNKFFFRLSICALVAKI